LSYDKFSDDLRKKRAELTGLSEAVNKEADRTFKWKKCGFWHKTSKQCHELCKTFAILALGDVSILMLLLLLIVTLYRLLPLLNEMYEAGAVSPLRQTSKSELKYIMLFFDI
jgi:hypothetical protein